MKLVNRECFERGLCINEPKERLFMITDDKSPYVKRDAYREVVLQRGDDIVDIVYERGAWRARHDFDNIKSELITYGYDRAKELAEYIKQVQADFNKMIMGREQCNG